MNCTQAAARPSPTGFRDDATRRTGVCRLVQVWAFGGRFESHRELGGAAFLAGVAGRGIVGEFCVGCCDEGENYDESEFHFSGDVVVEFDSPLGSQMYLKF